MRPKILHVGKFYPPHRGGIETHLETMCKSLTPWFACEVLVANDNRRRVDETLDGIPVKRLSTWANMAGAPVCPEMIREIAHSDADLVHIQWPNPAAFVAYLASNRGGPMVVSWQSDVVRQKLLGKLFAPAAHMVLTRATRILASSPNYASSSPILRNYAAKTRVVPLGIATERFRRVEPASVRSIRERYGERIVLAVGRFVYYKGFEFLIRAMREVRGVLLLVGDGPLRPELERQCRECGVSDRVFFPGSVEDLVPFYQACDVFVLPSIARSEAFGIVQLEAMACGKPVVNTRLDTGVTYVSPGGLTGITVPPADARGLAKAVGELLDDPALREKYGQAGLRRVEQEFSLEQMATRLRDVYFEALSEYPAAVKALVSSGS